MPTSGSWSDTDPVMRAVSSVEEVQTTMLIDEMFPRPRAPM